MSLHLTKEEIALLTTPDGIEALLKSKPGRVQKVLEELRYDQELHALQVELVKMQRWIQEQNLKMILIFEGMDAAGKGGAILRFTRHLSPRGIKIVALPKPSDIERGQWYFQRYVNELPAPGQIVFFDRSWYNRAIVEPVMGFCEPVEYERFMNQVQPFEHMLIEAGIILIKMWFSIDKNEQRKRFEERKTNPLKQWKLSPVDEKAQDLWDRYAYYKDEMFKRTNMMSSPWIIIEANNKQKARLESIRYVLSQIPYVEKEHASISLEPDPQVVVRY